MADSTANRTSAEEKIVVDSSSFIVKNLETMAKKRYTAVNSATGFVENAEGAAGLLNFGWASENAKGDNLAVIGNGTDSVEWTTRENLLDDNVAIAGIGSKADIHKPVYPSDNQTLSITAPAVGTPNGFVSDWISGTTGDLQLFSREGAVLLGLLGGAKSREVMNISSKALEAAAATVIGRFTATNRGRITGLYAVLSADDAGTVAGDVDLNLQIGGVDVTGGVLPLAFGDTQGTKISAPAITALNVFNGGQDITLEIGVSTTPFTTEQLSLYHIYIEIEHLPGA